jgi:hypothetical protein
MAALSKRDIEMIFRAETDAAQRPVNELSSDVKKLRQTLEDLTKASGKTDKSLDELANTTRELEKAQTELGTARTLLTQLNSQAQAVERAEAAVEKAAKKYSELKTQVEGAEAPTKRLTTSYAAAEKSLSAHNARLEEARKDYADVKGSIESIIGPVNNVQDAFRTVAVAQREITQGLAVAKGATAGFKAEIADTKVEADRLAQVDAFRKLAADSIAATSAADRISTGLAKSTTNAQSLANAILGLVNPAAAAATTLDGMDARLDAVVNKLAGGKVSVTEFGHLNNELAAVQAGLIGVSAEIDKFTAQETRVASAAAAFDLQRAKVQALQGASLEAGADVAKLTKELKQEEGALTESGAALDRETAKLNELSAALKRAGVDTNALPAAITRIEQSANKAAPAIQKVTNAVTPGGKKGFLGLDPYALQNLSYQVNDVFTGLASGQPIFQIFAQQSGQIAQLFPGIISGFIAWAPVIVPVVVALGTLVAVLNEANTQLEIMRDARTVIASLGDTNGYDPAKFKQIVENFRDLGVSAEDATAAAKTFVTEGLNPAAVDDYIVAAKNLADVQGIDVKTATEELTKAFTGGAKEVLALDDKYHFLTESQRDNLNASIDTKNEYKEVNKAFTQLYNKMQDGADAARGPMTDATNTLRGAWRGLLQTFADTGVITSVTNYIADAVRGFAYLINLAKRLGAYFKGTGDAFLAGGPVGGPFLAGAVLARNIAGGGGNPFKQAWDDTGAQMQRSQQQYTRPQEAPTVDAGAGSAGRQRDREAKQRKDRKQGERDAKRAAREAEAERKRREAEAKRLAKEFANEQDQLTSQLSRVTATALKGQQAPLEQQLDLAKQAVDEQFKALEDRLADFRTKFGPNALINGMSQADYAAQLARNKAIITQTRQLGVYEDNINDIIKSRDEKLKAIKEQQDAGLISAQEALRQTQEVTSTMGPQIDGAIESARKFISTLTPSAETQALLDKFARIQSQSSGPEAQQTIVRNQAQRGLDLDEKKLNDIFERRAALIQAANNLYDLGAISFTEKEARIKAAYTDTNKAITDQIATMRAYIEANKALLTPEAYTLALAQLDALATKLKYTNTLTQAVKQTAEQAIASGLTSMFDTLAQGIANVITGSGSLLDLLGNLGRAALSFAANFAKAIADAIIQIYALRIAKSLIGGFHGGGEVGSYATGQMKLSRNIGLPDISGVPRYHQGVQGAGLKSNEMLAVLQKGENVQTTEQQRLEKNRLDAARKGNSGSLRQVLAFGDEEVASAMQGPAGERTFVTFLRRNSTLLKQLLR